MKWWAMQGREMTRLFCPPSPPFSLRFFDNLTTIHEPIDLPCSARLYPLL